MALEQNEIKKVINVDLGNTSTSLKEYKKHIDELRGSLLQLDSSSEEYAKIAQEVKDEQDKLNEVMKVGKGYTDAVEGSYNQLVQTMADLKKQWRATADEAERADLSNQILEINNKLKDMDASTGNFQRNVGDYANAFEQAFDKCLDGIQTLDGPLGQLGGTVKQMLPVIKSINTTALTGLSGMKKAIASTGIGLLVVAVGTLAANWDKVSEALDTATTAQNKYTKAVEDTQKKQTELLDLYKQQNTELERTIRLMKAQGATTIETINTQITQTQKNRQAIQDEYNASIAKIEEYREEIRKLQKEEETASEEDSYRIVSKINSIEKALAAEKRLIEAPLEEGGLKARLQEFDETLDNLNFDLKEATEKAVTDIENGLKTAEEKLKESYERDKALLEEQGKDTTRLTQKYLADLNELRNKSGEVRETIAKRDPVELIKLLPLPSPKEIGLTLEAIKNEIETKKQEIDELLGGSFSFLEPDQTAIEQLDNEFQAYKELVYGKMALNMELLEDERLGAEERRQLMLEQEGLQESLTNATQMWSDKRVEIIENEKNESIKANMLESQQIAQSMSNLFGALSDMYDKDSEEHKSLAIMETIVNGLQAIIGTWAGYADMGIPGTIAAGIQTAAIIASTAATVAKIKSTNRQSSSASISAPQINTPSMTTVSPLLDEQADMERITTITEQQPTTQNMKVYVLEQDIRDAGDKVDVREANATF